jgi:DNA mismatch repair protein MutS2
LAASRRQARLAEAALRDRLEALVHSAGLDGALQEPLVTQRRDRFVLPVRSDARSLVPGLIHDQSASGATVFIEPLVVVELGNRLRAAQAAVANEVARILAALSAQIGQRAGDLARGLDAAAALDLAAARGRLALDWHAVPADILPEPCLDLRAARHPLLRQPVPVDLRLGLDFDALVLTGPNTGGKTVCLKIAGLFVCMLQAGLQLPAASAAMGIFPVVCGDAGDDQGVAQNLSTFSSHLQAVVAAERAVVPGALVLLDELGAGTDPGEGAVLAMALLEHLLARGARVLVTTHASELKAFAHRTPRVENGSVAFDPETLAPTYRLVIGVPGPSQALAIAERLGLPGAVVARARELQGPGARAVEQLIAGMASNERRLQEEAARAEEAARQAADLRAALEAERAELEGRRSELLEAARREALDLVADARRQADAVLRQLRRLAEEGGGATLTEATEERERLREAAQRLGEAAGAPAPRLHAGQAVRIRSLDRHGVLAQAPAEGGALVQCGALRLNVPLADIEPAAPPQPKPHRPAAPLPEVPLAGGVTIEHDLRGMDRWEAVARVDKALDDAVLAGLSQIRIIHGKGTGALREAVAEFLRGHPQVRGFRLGGAGEGGAGATVVELRG